MSRSLLMPTTQMPMQKVASVPVQKAQPKHNTWFQAEQLSAPKTLTIVETPDDNDIVTSTGRPQSMTLARKQILI